VAYLLLWVEIALSTYTLGTFRMSFGLFGGTELRILLALANLTVAAWPQVPGPWGAWRVFDLIGAVGIVGILVALMRSVARTTVTLYRAETGHPP